MLSVSSTPTMRLRPSVSSREMTVRRPLQRCPYPRRNLSGTFLERGYG